MKYKYLTSIIIIIFVLYISMVSILEGDKEVSILEGRSLEVIPLPSIIRNIFVERKDAEATEKVTQDNKEENNIIQDNNSVDKDIKSNIKVYITGILNGDYFKRWDNYFSDHIYGRDYIVKTYMGIQNKLDKKYINGVFIGSNDFLFSSENVKYSAEDIKNRNYYFEKIYKDLDKKPLYLSIVPSKSMIEGGYYPIEGYKDSFNYYIDSFINNNNLNIIDLRKDLISEKNLYYKTDHHMNMDGAYIVYNSIIDCINDEFIEIGEPMEKEDFQIENYKDVFMGSDGRKIGYLVSKLDDIQVYRNQKIMSLKSYLDNKNYSLIQEQQISEEKFNNDYLVYLGGDNSGIEIYNPESRNNLKILLIGDSMDNPIVPLVATHFKKTYSLDMRNSSEYNIIDKIKDMDVDIIMLIGNPGAFLDSSSEIFNIYK